MTRIIKQKLYKKSKKCFYCEEELPLKCLSVDHKVPKKNKGNDNDDNLVLACYKCNKLKGSVFESHHFKQLVTDASFRDFYWTLRKEEKTKVVKENKAAILQIWSYKNKISELRANKKTFMKVGISTNKIDQSIINITKEIKKLFKKLYLMIEDRTKKVIKSKDKLQKKIDNMSIITL